MVERITEARRLAILARDLFKVLVDLCMPPISRIPWDPCTAGDVLEAVGVILECPWEVDASGHGSWYLALTICGRRLHHLTCTSFLFCFHFISHM
jgi:hypothetical protein